MPKEIKLYLKKSSIGWRAFPPLTAVNMTLPVTVVSKENNVILFSDGSELVTGRTSLSSCLVANDPYIYSKFVEFTDVDDIISEGIEDEAG